jgi:biopolymer transport protein ExbD
MAKFKKQGSGTVPGISTASLPDIVFMLLFFFMVTTHLRETDLKIRVTVPEASEITKLEKKSLVSNIYIGAPLPIYQAKFGTEPRIQLNDQLGSVADVQDFIQAERETRDENEVSLLTTSLKIDKETKMGIVSDVKQELRRASALKVNYSSRQVIEKKKTVGL